MDKVYVHTKWDDEIDGQQWIVWLKRLKDGELFSYDVTAPSIDQAIGKAGKMFRKVEPSTERWYYKCVLAASRTLEMFGGEDAVS